MRGRGGRRRRKKKEEHPVYYHLGRSRLGSVTEPCTPNVRECAEKYSSLNATISSNDPFDHLVCNILDNVCEISATRLTSFSVSGTDRRASRAFSRDSSAFHCPVAHSHLLLIAKTNGSNSIVKVTGRVPVAVQWSPAARQSEAQTEETGPSLVSLDNVFSEIN
ncbi:hypothetical protein K0M31_017290 [Melipona bicolor]|uniref:Uncharacterized protein n=1 Tax=Melipona bicolor TaxID=60889 RepID=A0AA40G4I8_9HYME|nr:hypothetical protein K0M31_017290 [Melipona bicolor]